MAAQNTDIAIQANSWVRVTNNTVSAIRLNPRGNVSILVEATTGLSQPTNLLGAVELRPSMIWAADVPLSQMFPGLITTVGHVWVYAYTETVVSVSHAAA